MQSPRASAWAQGSAQTLLSPAGDAAGRRPTPGGRGRRKDRGEANASKRGGTASLPPSFLVLPIERIKTRRTPPSEAAAMERSGAARASARIAPRQPVGRRLGRQRFGGEIETASAAGRRRRPLPGERVGSEAAGPRRKRRNYTHTHTYIIYIYIYIYI